MAEIITAFPDVQIAMANTGRLDLDQDLRSRRLRRRHIHLFQGCIEIGDLETLHRFSPIGAAFANKMRAVYWSKAFPCRGMLSRPLFSARHCHAFPCAVETG